jgi:hypothetical protein
MSVSSQQTRSASTCQKSLLARRSRGEPPPPLAGWLPPRPAASLPSGCCWRSRVVHALPPQHRLPEMHCATATVPVIGMGKSVCEPRGA